MKNKLRLLRENIASISAAVRASGEYTRAAARAHSSDAKTRSSLSGIPL